MKKVYFFVYLMVITMPLLLGLVAWQSTRYLALQRDTIRLDREQIEWVEVNNRLIAGIAAYSSPKRIDQIARYQLNLQKIRPEHLLQVRLVEGARHER